MREWLSGGASPCQGEGRGFDSRLALWDPEGIPFLCPDDRRSTPAGGSKGRVSGCIVHDKNNRMRVVHESDINEWILLKTRRENAENSYK